MAITRKCRLRDHDGSPRAHEILVPLVLWSAIFEICLPLLAVPGVVRVADHVDVLAYTCGAALAAMFWRMYYRAPAGPWEAGPSNNQMPRSNQ